MTYRDQDNSPSGDDGFSLVEVLVVLILVSIMAGSMTMMAGSFRRIIEGSDRNGAQLALHAAARHAARLIELAERMPIDGSNNSEAVFLLGGKHEIRFVGLARLGAATQGLRTLTFQLKDGRENGKLVQKANMRRQEGSSAVNSPVQVEAVVAEDIESISFSYYGVGSGKVSEPAWQDNWAVAGKLPQAVTITITARSNSARLLQATETAYIGQP